VHSSGNSRDTLPIYQAYYKLGIISPEYQGIMQPFSAFCVLVVIKGEMVSSKDGEMDNGRHWAKFSRLD
jgi:hypothetical protein